MEAPDIIGTAAGGAGGVLTMGYVAKLLIQNWIKRNDEATAHTTTTLKQLGEKYADALEAIRIELAKISVRLEHLQTSADATVEYGKTIAVMEVRLADFGKCLNGLGGKVKRLENGASD